METSTQLLLSWENHLPLGCGYLSFVKDGICSIRQLQAELQIHPPSPAAFQGAALSQTGT